MRRKDREVADINQIRKILDTCKTCHLAMVDHGKPYVVPLSYGYTLDNDLLTLVFHCAKEGRKISILQANSAVCFEVSTEGEPIFDEATPCDYGYYFASIIGFGNAEFVTDFEGKNAALKLITKHQANVAYEFSQTQTNTVSVLKIVTTDFTGKIKPGR
ncbi:MAG: pyridoxamine 5'-phosphate oxidase family protein [Oscillospiraceae bacterium]|nr:pyridoxamine 5'-phosphate oxidase family protein [Oscillospiraceae bacterium]